jgi:hypothetical protein
MMVCGNYHLSGNDDDYLHPDLSYIFSFPEILWACVVCWPRYMFYRWY